LIIEPNSSFTVGRNSIETSTNDLSVSKHSHKLLYDSTFSGLQSFGQSGMTILEELVDIAFKACGLLEAFTDLLEP
jgi:hypothetical protein